MSERASATATVAVRVAATQEQAFDLFTREIDAWWRRGPKFRHGTGPAGVNAIECREGGRVVERWRAAGGEREFELGVVRIWLPPERLVFSWRNATFAPLEETEVDVTFAAAGAGTLVTVRHRGWERLREDHPAKHGLARAAFASELGLWWGDQLSALRECATRER
jgi:uncharacterized protein YndB with AHSA1/START domain